MRYNDKELQALSRQPAEMAAELGMRGPKKGSVVKRRLVKLVVNFLFYFRTDEAEASWRTQRGSTTSSAAVRSSVRSGWLRCVEPGGVLTEPRARRSLGQCGALGAHSAFLSSYEFMRRSLIFYRNEIQKMTGKDPLEQFGISEEARFQLSGLKA
ncbi:pleckstrin homology domain-containing family J member 1 isoform X1 [Oryx dammah]|uniref:Pleckstrin homology domain containing J1 n=1 Tax=Ovis aries TaxID=9940 RepID=A0AC11D2T6_SHEEP|nr:pleckstrin homology domain-containing family J member 1 isoform X1 [Oryx dammah]